MPRKVINEKIMKNSEITTVLREDKVLKNFVSSIYDANYD